MQNSLNPWQPTISVISGGFIFTDYKTATAKLIRDTDDNYEAILCKRILELEQYIERTQL